MLQGKITGIDPFVPWSTFKGRTLNIPRGLFYGGIFYTSEQYTPPCHISYISGAEDDLLLGTWGIASADGKDLAQIYFENAHPNVGKILTLDGEYAGCLKGLSKNFNENDVEILSGESLVPSTTLEVFLRSIRGEHILDADSLILDACICTAVPGGSDGTSNQIINIDLPDSCILVPDDDGRYYIEGPVSGGLSGDAGLSEITIGGVTLEGSHLEITPWTISGSYSVSGTELKYDSEGSVGSEDIAISGIDGGIVIGPVGRVK